MLLNFNIISWSRDVSMGGIKTTSMENVSTGLRDKNKEHYLRCKIKTKKIWCFKTYTVAYVKIRYKNEDLESIVSNLQHNYCLKVDLETFQ